jgi:hypothetical protein
MSTLSGIGSSSPEPLPPPAASFPTPSKPPDPSLCHLCQKAKPLPGYQFCGNCWASIQRQGRPASLAPPPTPPGVRPAAALGGFALFGLPAFAAIAYPGCVLFAPQAQAAVSGEGWNKIVLPFGLGLATAVPLLIAILVGLAVGAYGAAQARHQCYEQARMPVWAYVGLLLLGFVGGALFRAASGPIP